MKDPKKNKTKAPKSAKVVAKPDTYSTQKHVDGIKRLPPPAPEPILTASVQEPARRGIKGMVGLRLISLIGGTTIVAFWTMLRFITNGVNFDIVGQVGLAQQWAQGIRGGAQLGPTNYILKIPAYILVNHLSFLTPLHRLIVLALVFNVLTFVLLWVVYELTMNLFQVKKRAFYYVMIVWLATIAGNLFWLDYANSRNLETVGGLLFVYLTLRLLKRWQWQTLVLLVITGGVVFFADPLQAYIFAPSVVLFSLGRLVVRRTRVNARFVLGVSAATAVAAVIARVLQLLATKYLHITFLVAPTVHHTLTVSYILTMIKTMALHTLVLFDANFLKAPLGPKTLRQVIDALVLALLVALLVRFLCLKRKHINEGSGLLVVAIVVNYGVYAASGQVLAGETSRYLLMVPLLMMMLLAIAGDTTEDFKRSKQLIGGSLLAVALAAVLLAGAFVISWPARFSKDAYISNLVIFMHQQGFTYALGSREAGIDATYFGQGSITVLPSACTPSHLLAPTDLFYDRAAFKGLNTYAREVPILLQNDAIQFGPLTCGRADIIAQFGAPKREVVIPGFGSALVYDRLHLSGGTYSSAGSPSSLPAAQASTLSDVTLSKLGNCADGTVDTVIAHPDDDILFMNPILSQQFGSKCIRTVFVTAADDGRPEAYWLARQHGIEAAYAKMANTQNDWTESKVIIAGHKVLTKNLAGTPNVGLIFMRLPDGNLRGQGFAQTGFNSIEKSSHTNTMLKTVDNSGVYNYADIIQVVSDVIAVDKPGAIFTHLPSGGLSVGDHSDHRAVGALTLKARERAKSNALVSEFVGYPLNFMVRNLDENEIAAKRSVFEVYASNDQVICKSASNCNIETTYGKYLERCYAITQLQDLIQAEAAERFTPPQPNSQQHN